MIKRASDLSLFSGFKVGSSILEVSHIQYVDDTLILVDPLVDNFWSIKSMMRKSDINSVYKVSFHKSRLIEINVDPNFLS